MLPGPKERAAIWGALGAVLSACAGASAPMPEIAPPAVEPKAAAAPVDASLPPPPVDRIVRRSILLRGTLAGTSVTTIHPDGSRDTAIALPGLGIGYEAKTHAVVAPDHTLTSLEELGRDETGRELDDHFFLEDGRATWKNDAEQGTRAVRGPAFYVPRVALGSPARDAVTFALLTEALLTVGGQVALLPDGQARAEVEPGPEENVTVHGPDGATKELVAWSIRGLSLVPSIAWVDETNAFWGGMAGVEAVVPEGWEGVSDSLAAAARGAATARDKEMAQRFADRPAEGLAIAHARVLDLVAKAWLLDRTVVIKGDKIAAIFPSDRKGDVPPGVETVDANGKALLPGLWDLTGRFGPAAGPIYLAAGVTSVAVGEEDESPRELAALSRAFDEGTAVGPHVLRAAAPSSKGGDDKHEDKTKEPADDIGSPVQSVAFRLPPQVRRHVSAGGTESIGGLVFPRALALAVKGKVTPADVLTRVTIGAAKAMKLDKMSGSIAVGKVADLLLVDGDPLKDVEDLAQVVKVVRGGVVYDTAPLLGALGIEPASRPGRP